nr:uncharacterized protein LOC109146716 [Ipomoea trifida]
MRRASDSTPSATSFGFDTVSDECEGNGSKLWLQADRREGIIGTGGAGRIGQQASVKQMPVNLLGELGVTMRTTPILITDNLSASYVCKNPVFHSRMKHLALDYFFVREQVTTGSLRVGYVKTSEQVADLLTKPLGQRLFTGFRNKLGLADGASILRGRVDT